MRRLWPTVVALVLGTVGLVWVLVSLQRVFVRERDAALDGLELRRRALSHAAAESLRRTLHRQLEEQRAALEVAAIDPLLAGDGLLVVREGERLVPLPAPMSRTDTPLQTAFLAFARGSTTGTPDTIERLRRVRALAGRSGVALASRLAALDAHRAVVHLPLAEALAARLLALELLEAGGPATLSVRRALLDGPDGLQRSALRARGRLSGPDFAWLVGGVVAASERAGLPSRDFERVASASPRNLLVLPPDGTGPALSGDFYVEPEPDGWTGIAVQRTALEEDLADELRDLGLVGPEARVAGIADAQFNEAIERIAPRIETPEWAALAGAVERAYRVKTGIVLAAGALVLLVFGLATTAQSRKLRLVQLRSAFVATVSHELRTPLAGIRLLAETLERRLEGTPEARDYPARILREAEGLSLLVENILSLNRMERGRWVPRPERITVGTLVQRSREHATPLPPRSVHLDVVGAEVELEADPAMMQLVLSNLFRNACTYNRHAEVDIRVEAVRAQGVRLRVSDNGAGIAPSDARRLFSDFFRASAAPEFGTGTGLGLALCRRIARLHGGDVRLATTGPGGSTFEVRLPA